MSLTSEQEERLRTLKSQRITLTRGIGQSERVQRLEKPLEGAQTQQQFGILPDPADIRLQELRSRRAQIISRSAKEQAAPDELISQLFGIGPLDEQPTRPPVPQVTGDPAFSGAGTEREQIVNFAKRKNALVQLRKKFSDDQIQNAVQISNLETKAETFQPTDIIPVAAGALAGLATGGPDPTDIATVPFVSKLVANLIRSGATTAGTAGGEILRQKITNEPIDVKRAGKVGLIDGLLDFTGGTVFDMVGSTMAPFKQSIIPEAQAFAEDFARVGEKLGSDIPFRITPAQLTASGAIDTFETIAETSPTSRGSIRNLKKVIQPKQFEQFTNFKLDEIADGIKRLDATDLAPIIDDALRGKKGTLTLAKMQSRRNYAALDELVGDASIDLRPLKKFAQDKLDSAAKIGGRSLSPSGRSALQDIILADEKVSYQLAAELRSSFLGDLPAMKFVKDRNVGLIQTLAKKTDELISSPGSKFGISEKADAMRRIANKFHAENFGTGISGGKVGTFNNRAIKSTLRAISENEPDKLIPLFFRKNGRATVEIGKETLGNKTFTRLRSTWLDDIIRRSSTADGTVKGNVFLHNINLLGPETLEAVFPNPEHLRNVMEIGVGSQIIQKATGGAGNLASQQAQFGAILAITSGATATPRGTVTALGILGAPKLMAAVINSPKASKLLVEGMRLPIGSKAATSIFARSIRAATQKNKEPILEEIRQLQEQQQKLGQ